MGRVARDAWRPDLAAAEKYDALYAEYVALVDYFGRHGNDVMRRLRKIRREALS
jgi:L-ribulokinase